jgi:ribosomal subunit interface protein
MSAKMEIPWNVITKNIDRDEFTEKKIREKVAKIAKHLEGFPKDSVHLHVALERNPKKDCFTARLTLRVPSNILHSEKTTDDLIKALNLAVDSLLHDLDAFKATLTDSRYWKRKERRDLSHYLKSAAFALEAQAAGTGPQNDEEVVRDLFQRHYRDLLHHARRELRHDEEAGEIPPGAIDAKEVLDEVSKRAAGKAKERPRGGNWMVWFYQLIHEELERRRYLLKSQEPPRREQPGSQPQGKEQVQPPREHREPEHDPLDDIVTQKDTLELLQHEMRTWPRPERELFELYYVEGFDLEEIAVVTGYPLKTVEKSLASVRQKLREWLHEQEAPV